MTNQEEQKKKPPDVHEDARRRMVPENESNGSRDKREIAPDELMTPSEMSSTHEMRHGASAIKNMKSKEDEEISMPDLAFLLQSPDYKSLEAMASVRSPDDIKTLSTNLTIPSTHEMSNAKKKEVQFSSEVPELVVVSSSDESSRGKSSNDSVATDSIHSIRLSPTMLTIDTTDTNTTKGSINVAPPTTMENHDEGKQVGEEEEEAEQRAKLAGFESFPLQPQNSVNTRVAVAKTPLNDAFISSGTVLGCDLEPQSSNTTSVPFAFNEDEDIHDSPSRLMDMEEHEYALHKIARVIGSQAFVEDLATLYYDRVELHVIHDKEFCSAVELALQESKQTTQDEIEDNGMCAENPLKCAVADEDWDSLVASITAVASCEGNEVVGGDFVKQVENSVAKSTSALEETYETSFDEIKASLEDDRQHIATLLDSWAEAIQASTAKSTDKDAVTRNLSISQEKVAEIADSLEHGRHEFADLVKSWAEEIQASSPTTNSSDGNVTGSEELASEMSFSEKMIAKSDVGCREMVVYTPDQSVAVANNEASIRSSVKAMSITMCRDLILHNHVKSKADETPFESQAVLFLRMMAELFGEAFGEIAVSLQDNLKQADVIVQSVFVFVDTFLDSSSTETCGSPPFIEEVVSASHDSKPTESALESNSLQVVGSAPEKNIGGVSIVKVVSSNNESKPTESAIESNILREVWSAPDETSGGLLSIGQVVSSSHESKASKATELAIKSSILQQSEETAPSEPSVNTNHVVPLESSTDGNAVAETNATQQTNETGIDTIETDELQSANMANLVTEGSTESQDPIPGQESKIDETVASETEVTVEPAGHFTPNASAQTLNIPNDKTSIDKPNLNKIKSSFKEDFKDIQKSFQSIVDGTSSTSDFDEIPASLGLTCQKLERHTRELIQFLSSIFDMPVTESKTNERSNNEASSKSVGCRDQLSMESNDIEVADSNNCMLFIEVLGDVFNEDPKNIEVSFKEDYLTTKRLVERFYNINALSCSDNTDATEDKLDEIVDKSRMAYENPNSEDIDDFRRLIEKGDTNVANIDEEKGTKDSSDTSEAAPRSLSVNMAQDKSLITHKKNEKVADISSKERLELKYVVPSVLEGKRISAGTAEDKSDNDVTERHSSNTDERKNEREETVDISPESIECEETRMDEIMAFRNSDDELDGRKVDDIMAFRGQVDLEDTLTDAIFKTANDKDNMDNSLNHAITSNEPVDKDGDYTNTIIPATDEKKVVSATLNKMRTVGTGNKVGDSASKKENVTKCRRPVKKARRTELMNTYKEVFSQSTLEKKGGALPSKTSAECRRPAKRARKSEPMNEYAEVVSPSMPETNVVILPPRESNKKILPSKMWKRSAIEEVSDCENTLDCSDDTDDGNSVGDISVTRADIDATCFLGNVFDTVLESVFGPCQLSDDSSLSSCDGHREVKHSLRELSSKRQRKTRFTNSKSSHSTKHTSNVSIGVDGGHHQQAWRRPRLNRKVRYSK
jgi:hypothetical protein